MQKIMAGAGRFYKNELQKTYFNREIALSWEWIWAFTPPFSQN